MKRIIMGILMMFVMQSSLYAGTAPTQENVTKLYVATFNRAPDAAGLNYWVTGAGLDLEGIAQSFFDQPETQEVYPSGSTTANFVEAVYSNLFNRASDQAGLDYWIGELDSGRLTRSVFIQAAINGAQDTEEFGNDAMILMNKTTVGLAFANAGLNDTTDARDIMLGVTDGEGTVTAALLSYEISATPTQDLATLLAGKTLYTGVWGEMATFESMSFSSDLKSSSWQEIVDVDDRLDNGNGTLTIAGMIITYTCTYDSGYDNPSECSNEEPYIMTVTEIREDYMLVLSKDEEGEESVNRVYYDEAKAREYFLAGSPTQDLTAVLAGKTVYTTIWDDIGTMESWSFSVGMTQITWQEMIGGTDSDSEVISGIDGNTITLNTDEGAVEITVKEFLADYLVVEVTGGELGSQPETLRLYFDEAKARAYLLAGSSTVDLTALNTPVEVEKNIIGTWSKGCRDEGAGSESDTFTFAADGTGYGRGAYYHTPGCNPGDEADEWDNTFTYVIGESTTGANGEAAVEIDQVILENGKTITYYDMFHFIAVNKFIKGDDGSDDESNTPETRDNVFLGRDVFTLE